MGDFCVTPEFAAPLTLIFGQTRFAPFALPQRARAAACAHRPCLHAQFPKHRIPHRNVSTASAVRGSAGAETNVCDDQECFQLHVW